MAANQSLEQILSVQSQKLQDLEKTTNLLQCKNLIQDDLSKAYEEIGCIIKSIDCIKGDINAMKNNNTRCIELSNLLTLLDKQIQHMESNIPSKIHEYVNFEIPENVDNTCPIEETRECANNSLNNVKISSVENYNNHLGSSSKKSCKKILFNEPEIPQISYVTEDEYSKIPKYIIGRHNLEILNNLVTSINQIIKSKYLLISMGKVGARKKGELDLYLHYKKEQTVLGIEEENTYFFTPDDYEKYIKSKLDKIKLNLLIALRHCKRLREIRTAKTVHYALIISN